MRSGNAERALASPARPSPASITRYVGDSTDRRYARTSALSSTRRTVVLSSSVSFTVGTASDSTDATIASTRSAGRAARPFDLAVGATAGTDADASGSIT